MLENVFEIHKKERFLLIESEKTDIMLYLKDNMCVIKVKVMVQVVLTNVIISTLSIQAFIL